MENNNISQQLSNIIENTDSGSSNMDFGFNSASDSSSGIFEWIKKYKQHLISENNPTVYESVWDGYPILDHLEGYRTLI